MRAADALVKAMLKLMDRLIVAEPFATPQPFMGPVIDNAAADQVQSQFLDLMIKGGRVIRRLDRPQEDKPFLTPALIDVTDVSGRPDEEIFGPALQLIRVADFDAAIAEVEQHALRACRKPGRRVAAAVRPLLERGSRRGDQLEQADQRRAVQCAVRRRGPQRQSSAERGLCGGLLRVSGDQQRSRRSRALRSARD